MFGNNAVINTAIVLFLVMIMVIAGEHDLPRWAIIVMYAFTVIQGTVTILKIMGGKIR